MFTARLVVYDRALVTQGRQILFDDVLGMRYRTVNQGIGPYTLALTLRTTASDGVNITVASRGAVDDDLDALCELLAARIAARMSDQIAVSGSIAWGKASRLTRDGIETIAHGDSITIPYEECEIEFQGPYAIASTRSLKRPLRVADLYDWNFQAGLMVIRQRSRGTS